jgi:RNA polymerase sigma factor (sigma-70 family)
MSEAAFQGVIEYLRRTVAAHPGAGVSDGQLLDRFVTNRDEAAFELLIWRHGKMVMGTCQRVLRDPQEAENAFQACFLVLARKAGAIGRRQSIGAWLYRVAYRLALHGRTSAARRRNREWPIEDSAAAGPGSDPVTIAGWKEVRPLLDQAIQQLPERFRTPFVLRHLEGLSNRQIAAELGCSEGTVESRLSRARRRLRGSLTRQGVTLGVGALAVALCEETASAAIARAVVLETTRAAVQFTSASFSAALLTPQIVQLAQGALQAMTIAKIQFIGSLVFAGTLACGTAGYAAYHSLVEGHSEWGPTTGVGQTAGLQKSTEDAKPAQGANKEELLAPRQVHLIYKDTPLREALADFKRQAGYDLALSDPGNRLKGRKITLDTGKVSFWTALALFCEHGELMDNADSSALRPETAFTGGAVALGGAVGGGGQVTSAFANNSRGQAGKRILLTDGVPTPVPSYVQGAVRVRVAPHLDATARPGGSELLIPLKIAPEPRFQWLRTLGVHIDRAIDDQGQSLQQADKSVKPEQPIAGNAVGFARVGQAIPVQTFMTESMDDSSLKALLSKGGKPTTKLSELSGKVKALVLGPPTPLVTVTDVLDSVGKVGKTTDGGTFELLEASKSDDGKVTVSFILESPAAAGVASVPGLPGVPALPAVPAMQAVQVRPAGVGAVDVVVAGVPQAAAAPAAPVAFGAQGVNIVRRGVSLPGMIGTNQEFNLYDDRGTQLPRTATSLQSVPGRPPQARQYKLTFDGGKNSGVPSKLVYTSRTPVQVEIPFTLRNVEIPTGKGEDQEPE